MFLGSRSWHEWSFLVRQREAWACIGWTVLAARFQITDFLHFLCLYDRLPRFLGYSLPPPHPSSTQPLASCGAVICSYGLSFSLSCPSTYPCTSHPSPSICLPPSVRLLHVCLSTFLVCLDNPHSLCEVESQSKCKPVMYVSVNYCALKQYYVFYNVYACIPRNIFVSLLNTPRWCARAWCFKRMLNPLRTYYSVAGFFFGPSIFRFWSLDCVSNINVKQCQTQKHGTCN